MRTRLINQQTLQRQILLAAAGVRMTTG